MHCSEAARFGNSVIEGEWGNYLKADILAAIELAEGQQGNDGQDGHNSGQCGGSAVVAADDLGVDCHRQGLGFAGIQDDGGGQFTDHGDPAQDGTRDDAGGHHGHRDAEECLHLGSTQRDGSFLNAHGDLLQDSHRRADGIGQTPDDECHHHDEHGAADEERGLIEADEQCDTKDRAGHDIGDHRENIHHVGQGVAAAHHQIGDENSQQHDDDQCQQGDDDGVLDAATQLADGGLVALQRVAVHKDLALRVLERGVDDVGLRHDGDAHHQIDSQMHQSVDALAGLPFLHGVHTVQSEGVLVGNVLLDEEHQRGDDDSNDGDSGCKAVAAAHLVDELSVKDNREGTVALTDQHRGAEVCKGSHEHQQSRSQQGGHDQRHDHFEEAGNARASEVLSRLDEGVVDILQCTLGVEEHQREQLERHDQHDAAEAVDVRDGDAEVFEEGGDDTTAAQQQDP